MLRQGAAVSPVVGSSAETEMGATSSGTMLLRKTARLDWRASAEGATSPTVRNRVTTAESSAATRRCALARAMPDTSAR